MWLLIIEAFIALGMLVFIIWWTMSSRRRNEHTQAEAEPPALVAPDPSRDGKDGTSDTGKG